MYNLKSSLKVKIELYFDKQKKGDREWGILCNELVKKPKIEPKKYNKKHIKNITNKTHNDIYTYCLLRRWL